MKPPFEMIQETDIEKWRYETFWTKEPETIEWIKSFNPDSCFVDVGANIGVYSLYSASLFPDMKILSFEPVQKNFESLTRNVLINKFKNLLPIPFVVGNKMDIVNFACDNRRAGETGGQVSDIGEQIIMVPLDYFIDYANIGYVKIDIDGQELEVVKGMNKLLKQLTSVLIEVNNHKEEIIEIFKQNGFTTDNRFNTMTPHSRERRAKEGIDAENIIFTRC